MIFYSYLLNLIADNNKAARVTAIVAGVVLSVVGTIGLALGYVIWRRRRNQTFPETSSKLQAQIVTKEVDNKKCHDSIEIVDAVAELTIAPQGPLVWPGLLKDDHDDKPVADPSQKYLDSNPAESS